MNLPSMCIPKTRITITRQVIIQKLNDLNIGEIERVILIPCTKLEHQKYQRVYIYFKQWYENPLAIKARTRLIEGKDIKIFYEDYNFWKIFANNKDTKSDTHKENENNEKEIEKNISTSVEIHESNTPDCSPPPSPKRQRLH